MAQHIYSPRENTANQMNNKIKWSDREPNKKKEKKKKKPNETEQIVYDGVSCRRYLATVNRCHKSQHEYKLRSKERKQFPLK